MKTRHKITYQTHDGTLGVDMTRGGYLYASQSLFDESWTVKLSEVAGHMGGSIISRYLEPFEHTVTLQIFNRDRQAFNALLERVRECFAYDMIRGQTGRLTVNGWTLDCNVTESRLDKQTLINVSRLSLRILAPSPVWYKETRVDWLSYDTADALIGKRYANRYGYRYGTNNTFDLNIDSVWPVTFAARFFGPCVNPSITVRGHLFEVSGACDAGESIVLDTRLKTVTKIITTGEAVNIFDQRGRASYPFAQLEGGPMSLTRAGDYPIELRLYQMRPSPEMEVR